MDTASHPQLAIARNGGAPAARAHKALSDALARLHERRQSAVAEEIGASETLISRHISNGHLERSIQILAALGLQVVDADKAFLDPADIEVLMHGHRRWVESMTISGLAKGVE